MSRAIVPALFFLLFAWTAQAIEHGHDFDFIFAEMETCASRGDFVSLRVLASRAAHYNMDSEQWARVRNLLHHNPSAGWDIIWKWDHLLLKDPMKSAQSEVNALWNQADALMAKKDFAHATPLYFKALDSIRNDVKSFGDVNFFAQQTLQHSIARSLFGEGRFAESLEAYQKISLLYPFVRQIQFEKMWAAFRALNYSLTLGAIASQMSSYFNRYMEPESYLVQYYLYRRLCRKKDMAQVLATVQRFKQVIEKQRLKIDQWAKFDLETRILLQLSRSQYSQATESVTERERQDEVLRIRTALEKRFTADLARLKSELEKVTAYLNMGSVAAPAELPAIPGKTDLKQILNSETEMWPVEDAEDWLDEIGHHHFVGQSECK